MNYGKMALKKITEYEESHYDPTDEQEAEKTSAEENKTAEDK